MRIAVFPGSFDPITIGHLDVVKRAMPLFDKIIVAIGINSTKKYLFDLERRLSFIEKTFEKMPQVSVRTYSGLTVNFCQKVRARFLLRGVRSISDFEFEKTIAQLNMSLKNIETVLFVAQPQFSHINSTIVREIIMHGGDATDLLPEAIADLAKAP